MSALSLPVLAACVLSAMLAVPVQTDCINNNAEYMVCIKHNCNQLKWQSLGKPWPVGSSGWKLWQQCYQSCDHNVCRGVTQLAPSPWTRLEDRCYWASSWRLDYQGGKFTCAKNHAHLVDIETQDEDEALVAWLKTLKVSREVKFYGYWIGLTANSTGTGFHWSDGSPVTWTNIGYGVNYTNGFIWTAEAPPLQWKWGFWPGWDHFKAIICEKDCPAFTVNPDPAEHNCTSEFGYYPVASDRRQFIQCSNYIASVMNCAPGTIWSQANLTCVHAV